MSYTEYNADTGRLGGVHTGYATPEEAMTQVFLPGMNAVVEGRHDTLTQYVVGGQVTQRPPSPITRSGETLLNVPPGATLRVDGVSYPIQGNVALNFPLSGTYHVRVECFPYLDFVDTIGVT